MSILNSSIVPASAGGDEIDNSLRFNRDDSAYLSRTPSSAGNRKTWTWSGWVKRGTTSSEVALFSVLDGASEDAICFRSDGKFNIQTNTGSNTLLRSNALYRDPSAWYHLVAVMDTTQATASDRAKMYVNGVQITDLQLNTYPAQNSESAINTTNAHKHGADLYGTYFDGYLAEVNFIDGQALDPSSFGEVDEDYGHWKPKKASDLTYGNNGFYLDFADSAAFGNDVSGNNNDFTNNNLAATDQMLDTPTNNFCTWNPNAYRKCNITQGSLSIKSNTVGHTYGGSATFLMESGKWYWEYVPTLGSLNSYMGIHDNEVSFKNTQNSTKSWLLYSGTGNFKKVTGGVHTTISGGNVSAGDVIQIAYDADAGKLWFGRNDTWSESGDPAAGTNAVFSSITSQYGGMIPQFGGPDATTVVNVNFGQDSSFAGNKTAQGNTDGNGYGDFYYEPPTGFLALCTQNLPDPDVIPSEHFNTVLWLGDHGSDRTISGVGFQPDLVWLKNRNVDYHNVLSDAIRGGGKALFSNITNAEATFDDIKSFESDGFKVSTSSGTRGESNWSGHNYVAWNWKANGSGVSNTDGTIQSTVSANTDAGFSIVSYTGNATNSTVGHGLSSAPDMIIVKNRDSGADSWRVGTDGIGWTKGLVLNTTAATNTSIALWNNTAPTTSVFSIGAGSSSVNENGSAHIAYCFHSVEGYSKFGYYGATGDTTTEQEKNFIWTGFRPRYIMIKSSTDATDWSIIDTSRDDYNPTDNRLEANTSNAENGDGRHPDIDILSNGFKIRCGASEGRYEYNWTGHGHIYMAFAETPFKYANAR